MLKNIGSLVAISVLISFMGTPLISANEQVPMDRLLNQNFDSLTPDEAGDAFIRIFSSPIAEVRQQGERKLEKYRGKYPEQIFSQLMSQKYETKAMSQVQAALVTYINAMATKKPEEVDTVLTHLISHPNPEIKIAMFYQMRKLNFPDLPKYFELATHNTDAASKKVLKNSFIYPTDPAVQEKIIQHFYAKGDAESKKLGDEFMTIAIDAEKYTPLTGLLKNPKTREQALYRYRSLPGPQLVQASSVLLAEDDLALRKTIVSALDSRRLEEMGPYFGHLFTDPSPKVKNHASLLFSEMSEDRKDAIYPFLLKHPLPEVRQTAHFTQIREQIRSKSPEQLSSAKRTLSNLNESDQRPILQNLLATMGPASPESTPFPIKFLSESKSRHLAKWFDTFLADSNQAVRMGSLKALSEVPANHQAQLIEELSERLDPERRSYLRVALSQFNSNHPGSSPKNSEQLEKMSKEEKEAYSAARHTYIKEYSELIGKLMASHSAEARAVALSALDSQAAPSRIEILSQFKPNWQTVYFLQKFQAPDEKDRSSAAVLLSEMPAVHQETICEALLTDLHPQTRQLAHFSKIQAKINSKNPAHHETAEGLLQKLNEADQIPVLRHLLREAELVRSSKVKSPFAVKYLSSLPHSKGYDYARIERTFTALLSDPDEKVRQAAVRGVSEVPVEHRAQLVKAVSQKIAPDRRHHLEVAMSQFHGQELGGTAKTTTQIEKMSADQKEGYMKARQQHLREYSDLLEKLTHSRTKEARETGIGAFGKLAKTEQLDLLTELFSRSDNPTSRRTAATLLEKVGVPDAKSPQLAAFYRQAFGDSDSEVRKAGAKSLAEMVQAGDESRFKEHLFPLIQALMEDPDENVAQGVGRAMQKVESKKFKEVAKNFELWAATQNEVPAKAVPANTVPAQEEKSAETLAVALTRGGTLSRSRTRTLSGARPTTPSRSLRSRTLLRFNDFADEAIESLREVQEELDKQMAHKPCPSN